MIGKRLHLSRFLYGASQAGLIVPLDHGLTGGPLEGIRTVSEIKRWITHSSICGVIVHKGMAERLIAADLLHGKGLMIHVNGMFAGSPAADTKERLTTIDTALSLGADGISLQVNFDGMNDAQNLRLLGQVVDEASRVSLPVLAMVYDKSSKRNQVHLRHLIRTAIELGCDAVKIAAPENAEELIPLLDGLSEDILIFVAGGPLMESDRLFELTRYAMLAGARGLCVGRNVFQREDRSEILTELRHILQNGTRVISEMAFESASVFEGAHS